MKCLRCGYCCHHLLVVIVDDPAKGIAEDNLKTKAGFDERCQHLRGNASGEYSCAIHDEPWYPDTPCASHTQVEKSPDSPCRMGTFIMKKNAERLEMDNETQVSEQK